MTLLSFCLTLSPYLPPFTEQQLKDAIKVYCKKNSITVPKQAPKLPDNDPFLGLQLMTLCTELMARIPTAVLEVASDLGLSSPENYKNILSISTQQCSPLRAIENFAHPPLWLHQMFHTQNQNTKIDVAHIPPSRYRHPIDIEVTQLLDQSMPFEGLARAISKGVAEQALQLKNDASAIRVSETQFPQLHHQFTTLANRLGVHPVPPLYVSYGPINAFTSGMEEPVVVIHEGCISQLSSSELDFILGHELGHIQFEHMLYQMISRMGMAQAMILAPNIMLSRLGGAATDLKIKQWSRMAELSCDRAGLLCSQDTKAAMKVLLRFAGAPEKYLDAVDIETYLEQYESHKENSENKLTHFLMGADRTHPWVLERIQHLHEWIESGEYDLLLAEGRPEVFSNDKNEPMLQYLQFLGLPQRYWISPEDRKSRTWVIGERLKERSLLSSIVREESVHSSEPTDAVVCDGDRVFFALNAQALLSESERQRIQKYHDVGAQIALFIFNFDDLEPSDKEEITTRIEDFVCSSKFPWFTDARMDDFQDWIGQPIESPEAKLTLSEQVEEWVKNNQPEMHILSKVLDEGIQKADKILASQFSALEESHKEWFEPMSIEERRYVGSGRLQQECFDIIQSATLAIESSRQMYFEGPKQLQLSARHPEIPKSLIASGLGSLAFGAVLFPGAPLWLILSGIGVGMGSVFSGRHILSLQRTDLSKQQLDHVMGYLKDTRHKASSTFQALRTHLFESHKKTLLANWSNGLDFFDYNRL